MRIDVAGLTHVGMKRPHNEDAFLLMPETRLFVVADGMGGHDKGEVASKLAVDELGQFFQMTEKDNDATWPFKMDKALNYDENRLACGIKLANSRIFEHQGPTERLSGHGMGTTIVSLHFGANDAYVGHVGDSRAYRFSDGNLSLLTEDHSLLNDMKKQKKMSQQEIDAFPLKNVIVRALGMKDSVQVDISKIELKGGEIFLLCSDGLSGLMTDDQIAEILAKPVPLAQSCNALVELANANGGTDNVTCILARYVG